MYAETMEIEITMENILNLDVDAIVNPTNIHMMNKGGGLDGAIRQAAGAGLAEECRIIGGCPTGEARVTGGYQLKAKCVIHTVGPVYNGSPENAALLASCYRNCLKCAKNYHLKSIAFPPIATGSFGYPKREAAEIVLRTLDEWSRENPSEQIHIILTCFGDSESYGYYSRGISEIAEEPRESIDRTDEYFEYLNTLTPEQRKFRALHTPDSDPDLYNPFLFMKNPKK